MPSLTIKLLSKSDNSKRATSVIREHTRAAVMETAQALLADVERRMPMLAGTYSIVPDGEDGVMLQSENSAIELGTSHQRARPHLRPAGEAQREPMRQRLAAAMRAAAEDI